MRFKRWYEMCENPWGSVSHAWYVVGPLGAVHCHVSVPRPSKDHSFGPSGGIECHWNHYRDEFDRAPDHLECGVTKRPCWHDGSSMYVNDHIVPTLDFDRLHKAGHEYVFSKCEEWYRDKIAPQSDAECSVS